MLKQFILPAGVMLILVALLLTPAGSAQAQCGCGVVCADVIDTIFGCILSDDPEACLGSPEAFFESMMTCNTCIESCADTSCYDNCALNIESGLECEPGDIACAFTGIAAFSSCMRACDDCEVAAPLPTCGFEDGRLDQYSCAQPVAVYCTADSIEVWDIDAAGNGTLLLSAPAAGDTPASNQTLARSGDVILSRLSTGEFQVNALDGEGNPYVLVWDGCPANEVYQIR